MSEADPHAATDEVPRPRPSRALEISAAGIAVAFMATYLALATQIELRDASATAAMNARTWPTVLGIAGLAVSIVLLAIAITRPVPLRDDLERVAKGGPLRVVLTVAISAVFIALWAVQSIVMAGYRIQLFPIIAALFLFVLLIVFGHRRWFSLIAYPVGVTAFIYVLFGIVLRIPL